MKNVVIFTYGGDRRAIELRWVREIVTLGAISRVPGAPDILVGAIQHRGRVVPVMTPGLGRRPAPGDPAIVVEVGELTFAIAADTIGEVTTLRASSDDQLEGPDGRPVSVLSPGELSARTAAAVALVRGAGEGP